MAYIPPQVIVNGDMSAEGSTAYVQPQTIALVCKIDKYPSKTASRILGNGATATISVKNLIESTVTVKDYSGNTLVKDTDYTMAVDQEASTFSITVINKDIKTQALLIGYQYLPDKFFEPLKWFTMSAITAYYGEAYDDNNNIASNITAAADYAFKNGATSLCILPVFDGKTSGNSVKQSLNEALEKLKLQQDIAIVCPIGFDDTSFGTFKDHILWCNEHQVERRGIFSLDGTAKTYSVDDLVSIASSLDSEFILFTPNTIAPVYVTDARDYVNLPGWLYGAAIAGLAIATSFEQSLTRHQIYGFYGTQSYLYEEKNILAQAGCCVLELQNGSLKIRHSVTTKQSSLIDWSYSGVYIYMMGSMRALYDPYIGQPSDDILKLQILTTSKTFLTAQVDAGIIYSYDSLEVSRRTGNPEVIDVSFRYAWLRPINWIYVNFAVDLTY